MYSFHTISIKINRRHCTLSSKHLKYKWMFYYQNWLSYQYNPALLWPGMNNRSQCLWKKCEDLSHRMLKKVLSFKGGELFTKLFLTNTHKTTTDTENLRGTLKRSGLRKNLSIIDDLSLYTLNDLKLILRIIYFWWFNPIYIMHL